MRVSVSLIIFLFANVYLSFAQKNDTSIYWHNKERSIHYLPQGNDFVCVNGKMRFNRALYGTNTAFRIEAGDLPEFALYMPGMGGNFKFGLIEGNKSKWLIDAQYIKATYRAGSMLYEIHDPILGSGSLFITILALADAEGMIIKNEFVSVNKKVELVWLFGGASGKKFSRDGDIGADPESSFYLQPEYCKNNLYQIDKNIFHLSYGTGKIYSEEERYEIKQLPSKSKDSIIGKATPKYLTGIVPSSSDMHIVDATKQTNPLQLYESATSATPAIGGKMVVTNSVKYFLIQNAKALQETSRDALENIFNKAETARQELASRIKISTPDAYINTLGSALSIAADAIWEDPSYLHGAVAWRMRLNAWRGPYVADPLGWHDRARKHFSSYALSQVTSPDDGPVVADTALHLARQLEKMGTSLFSSGYICRNPNGDIRPHHYDMNLVFIDELLNHFNWTGDTGYVKKMWPLLQRHLAWEKRNFDTDGDGLYDAYAAIWASDALQYSGGGVTHSSAYNYRANKVAAQIASIIGEDGEPYKKEAAHILNAMNNKLWMPSNGWYAEYKDALGLQLIHPSAGLWTIYHAIDSKVPDAFQAYQCLQYIDKQIPHIPVNAEGLPEKNLYLLSTTNWQPYTWSLNNVVLAENLQTSLAYWQANRPEDAYQLWRSSLIESMYLSASPGGFEQLSYYDAVRGELYRDFADPIGMAARSLVEGLFGIQPDALHDTLLVQPGFPIKWNYASLSIPDIKIDFKREKNNDVYSIIPMFSKKMHLKFKLSARLDSIEAITMNGKTIEWSQLDNAIGLPTIDINAPSANEYSISIKWRGNKFEKPYLKDTFLTNEAIRIHSVKAKFIDISDPQHSLKHIRQDNNSIDAVVDAFTANKIFFIKTKQGQFTYWQPFSFSIKSSSVINEQVPINKQSVFEKIDLTKYFNDKINAIFQHQYLSPRVSSPTLQLPTQGIGNWCYPLTQANINDNGLRKLAGAKNEIQSPEGVPFTTPSDSSLNNIVFTSQWDNFPKQKTIALTGVASQVYLLMAGSTNPMQSRMTNGQVIISYIDDSADTLQLNNPQNWWPIEQDYINDGYAFTTDAPAPLRFYLQDGKFSYGLKKYSTIKGFTNMAIEGGAATMLNMPLNPSKELRSLTVQTLTNDVIIGLMSVTLQRK
jgi:hypothetical protein